MPERFLFFVALDLWRVDGLRVRRRGGDGEEGGGELECGAHFFVKAKAKAKAKATAKAKSRSFAALRMTMLFWGAG